MNGTDHHLAVKAERPGDILDPLNVSPGFSRSAHLAVEFLEVVAGTKRPAGTPQHDHVYCRIGVGFTQSAKEVGQQFGINGVESLRAVQRHGGDGITRVIQHRIGHQVYSLISRRVLPSVRTRVPDASTVSATPRRSVSLRRLLRASHNRSLAS